MDMEKEKEKLEQSIVKTELPQSVEIVELDEDVLEDVVGGYRPGDANCGC